MSIATHRVFLDRMSNESGAVVTVRVIRTHTGLDLASAKHLWDEARTAPTEVYATTSPTDAYAMVLDLNALGHATHISTTYNES